MKTHTIVCNSVQVSFENESRDSSLFILKIFKRQIIFLRIINKLYFIAKTLSYYENAYESFS